MAARGALPLPPVELATVLFALAHDPDTEVKSRARESLEGIVYARREQGAPDGDRRALQRRRRR